MTKLLAKLFILLSFLTTIASAQSGAALAGTVKDPQGRPVPAATVTLFSRTGTAGNSTTSDATGQYHFTGLPTGDYLLRAAALGFAPFLIDDVHLAGGTTSTQAVDLVIGGVREQVIVTASSTPQTPERVSRAVAVIDRGQADVRDVTAISDAIALAPGVRVQQLGGPGSLTTIHIRGLRSQDTAVLVDGLRLRDASAVQGDATSLLEDLLLTNANRIEVMRGSGSSLYGTNAIGGVVNIITDEGGGRTRGSLLAEGGSLGTMRGRAQLAGGLQGDRIQYSLGLAETDVMNGVDGDLPFRDLSAQGRVTYHFSPSLRLNARMFGADSFSKLAGQPDTLGSPSGLGIIDANPSKTFLPAPDNPDATRAGRFLSASLILNGQLTPTLQYSLSYQLLSNGSRFSDGPTGAGFQPTGNTRTLNDGRIHTFNGQFHYRLGRFNLVSGGYEFESETYANDNTDSSARASASGVSVTQKSQSVFVHDQAQFFANRLQLSGAFRTQAFSLDTPVFLPLAGAPYQGIAFAAANAAYTGDGAAAYYFPRTETKLRAHVGRGYRAPSLYQRFGAGFDPFFGYTNYGDPRLMPEHSMSVDAGIDQTILHNRVQTSASYFYTWLQDVVAFDTSGVVNPASDPFGRFFGYLNTKGGISRGVEFSVTAAPTRSLRISGAYTYANAMERTPLVANVIQTFVVPRHQFSIFVTEQATRRLLLSFDTLDSSSYLAPIFGSSNFLTQTYRFKGIHKVNAGASYRLPIKEYQALRLFVRANNLFGQTYFESGFATPGRTALGGVQFEF
jgi:vitamin B12 transporter